MVHRTSIIVLTALSLLAGPASTWASTPTLVNHQGILTNSGGTPQVGTFTIAFSVYDVASGVNPALWTESRSITTDAQGRFTVLLGEVTPLPHAIFSGPNRWLGTAVSPDPEMTPRVRLVTVPFADRIATVDGAEGGTISTKVSIGSGHTNSGVSAFVTGASNTVTGDYATIGGGTQNQVDGDSATCAGGRLNLVQGDNGTVSGGTQNFLTGFYSTIAGGRLNAALEVGATVGGGANNEASGQWSTVPGGFGNVASSITSVAMGNNAHADDAQSFMWSDGTIDSTDAPKQFKVVAANGAYVEGNSASAAAVQAVNLLAGNGLEAYSYGGVGMYAHTDISASSAALFRNNAGGTSTATVRIENSHASGIGLNISTNSADATALLYNGNSSGVVLKCFDNAFNVGMLVMSNGRVSIGNIVPAHPLHLASGAHCTAGGTWTNASDRAAKENFHSVDPKDILEKVARLPITEWNYKNEDESIKHIGTMAQDFRAAFGLGDDDKSIGTIDADGVALAAIQALNVKTHEIDELKSQLADLQEQINALRREQSVH